MTQLLYLYIVNVVCAHSNRWLVEVDIKSKILNCKRTLINVRCIRVYFLCKVRDLVPECFSILCLHIHVRIGHCGYSPRQKKGERSLKQLAINARHIKKRSTMTFTLEYET